MDTSQDSKPIRERCHRLYKKAYVGRVDVMFTLCVKGRRPVLDNPIVSEQVVYSLTESISLYRCCIPIFVIMPDHIHLMIRGTCEESNTHAAMCSFKRKLGMRLPDIEFQKDFHDHIIKMFEGWENEVWYIANNPVRAGLVDSPWEWPFTGSIGFDLRDTFGR